MGTQAQEDVADLCERLSPTIWKQLQRLGTADEVKVRELVHDAILEELAEILEVEQPQKFQVKLNISAEWRLLNLVGNCRWYQPNVSEEIVRVAKLFRSMGIPWDGRQGGKVVKAVALMDQGMSFDDARRILKITANAKVVAAALSRYAVLLEQKRSPLAD